MCRMGRPGVGRVWAVWAGASGPDFPCSGGFSGVLVVDGVPLLFGLTTYVQDVLTCGVVRGGAASHSTDALAQDLGEHPDDMFVVVEYLVVVSAAAGMPFAEIEFGPLTMISQTSY